MLEERKKNAAAIQRQIEDAKLRREEERKARAAQARAAAEERARKRSQMLCPCCPKTFEALPPWVAPVAVSFVVVLVLAVILLWMYHVRVSEVESDLRSEETVLPAGDAVVTGHEP